MVNRHIMRKSCEENVDHLLLHYLVIMEFWNSIFVVFGVKWVLPKTVKGLFQCWQHSPKTLRNSVWNVIRNRAFEVCGTLSGIGLLKIRSYL